MPASPSLIGVLTVLFVAAGALPIGAADLSGRIVDGTGRPVEGVEVRVTWTGWNEKGEFVEHELVTMRSDADGRVEGSYEEAGIPDPEDLWFKLEKPGYQGYSSTEWSSEFVIERIFDASDLARIADLQGEAQIAALRDLLGGAFDNMAEEPIEFLAFDCEQRLRPALRALLPDERAGGRAAMILGLIGEPEDLRHVLSHGPRPDPESFNNRWAYFIVTAMLEPETDAEWDFLRRCAFGELNDLAVDAGAIQTLQLIASPRSRAILEEVKERNPHRTPLAAEAIAWIDTNPAPFVDDDLEALGRRVAEVVRVGTWEGNTEPRFNAAGDKAQIECIFTYGRDEFVDTATFHFVDGVWKLRGVRETFQAYLGPGHDDVSGD